MTGLAVPGEHDTLAGLPKANKLGQASLGFAKRDAHRNLRDYRMVQNSVTARHLCETWTWRNITVPIKLHNSFAVYPSARLRLEIVEPAGLSGTAPAERLRVTQQVASNLLNGNTGLPVEVAIRFGKAFGHKADALMRMQSAYALAEARAREKEGIVEAA